MKKSFFSVLLIVLFVAAFSFNAEAKVRKTYATEQKANQAASARAHARLTQADYERMAYQARKVPVGNKAKATPRPTTQKGYERKYYKNLESMGYTRAQIREMKRRTN